MKARCQLPFLHLAFFIYSALLYLFIGLVTLPPPIPFSLLIAHLILSA